MTSLPRGTVAFLMSDIEGSTRLIGITGEFYPQLLDDHHRLMRESIDGQGGTVVSTEGDSAFAVFPSVRQAVVGAIEALRTLDAHAWPPSATVNVRIGINAGEAIFGVGGANYTGLEVHRTARIMAAGHGGQVLISESARALVGDALPHGTALRDLGPHQLRDMPAPERLHQVVAPGLREEFPPPRTLTITAPTNLPATLTRFVGRTKELDEVHALLENHRLVTLTGPGGSGARCSSPQDFSRGSAKRRARVASPSRASRSPRRSATSVALRSARATWAGRSSIRSRRSRSRPSRRGSRPRVRSTSERSRWSRSWARPGPTCSSGTPTMPCVVRPRCSSSATAWVLPTSPRSR